MFVETFPWRGLYRCRDETMAEQGLSPKRDGDRPPAARLVRPPRPRSALAGTAGRAARSLPRLAVGDHAAADDGGCGQATITATFSRAGRRSKRLAAAPLDDVLRPGPGLATMPGPATFMLAPGRRATSWRAVSRHRGRLARAARHRPLYRRRHRGHRLRSPGRRRRRQCRARDGTALRRSRRLAGGQAADPRARAGACSRRSRPAISPRR